MGAVEHLKALCCLGLRPESAMIAVTPLLHEIIPHGWTRLWLFDPNGGIGGTYGEHPRAAEHFRNHLQRFLYDPSSPPSLILGPAYRAIGIGWGLHLQGRGYLESRYYHEVEAELDSCWVLDAMIGDSGRSIAGLHLTRPRSARPFTVDDVQRLDRLRPWLAHGFRQSPSGMRYTEDQTLTGIAGTPALSGQMILTSDDATIVFQTPSFGHLLEILAGEPANFTRYVPQCEWLPAPILQLPAHRWRRKRELGRSTAHAGFNRVWRSHARSEMANASEH